VKHGCIRFAALMFAAALLAAGCEDVSVSSQVPATQPKKVVKKKQVITQRGAKLRPKVDAQEELSVIEQAFQKSHTQVALSGSPEELAIRRVAGEIEKYVEVGPTLVIWLVDRTSSSFPLASAALPAARQFYQTDSVKQWSAGGEQKLLTAVAALDDKMELLLDPPSGNPQAAREALDKITPSSGDKELTFAAVKQLLARYESLRAEKRQIVIVLVSDEAGDDAALVDEIAATLKKHVIPLYAVGYAAPWGQTNPFRKASGPATKGGDAPDAWPSYGPESLNSERVHLPVPAAGFGFRSAELDELIDSGYGPFGIERLCRAGGGAFLAIRRNAGSFTTFGGTRTWPTGAEAGFDAAVVSRYAPDYVSADDYKRLLASSKSRQALVEAAKIGRAEILDNPNLSFPKVANEAQMKRQLDEAQQASARVAPQLDRLYEVLLAGEADRDRLDSPRWQAEFDYALGRVIAAKVRNDGYNQMIAALKAGKGPKDASTYVLEPVDSYETSSALKKMADKARMYLERVVKEHPGTPWARFAADDLKVPMGWKWQGQ
jgi:hypothetical protein